MSQTVGFAAGHSFSERLLGILLLCALTLTACQQEPTSNPPAVKVTETAVEVKPEQTPPHPPVKEDFEGEPKLSVFPRIADYQPASADELHPFWVTYIDHLVRTSGVVGFPREGSARSLSLSSIKSLDSVAWFAPLAVEPNSGYRVTAMVKAELPESASAGIALLEFDQFLWIGDQFTKEQSDQHQVGLQRGAKLTGNADWQPLEFSFRTGPRTNMIHLLLFRDGPADKKPVLFDNIEVEVLNHQ